MQANIRTGVSFLAFWVGSVSGLVTAVYGQSGATLFGTIFDPHDAVVPGARITMSNHATGEERIVETDSHGNYQIAALPAGNSVRSFRRKAATPSTLSPATAW